MLQLEDFGHSNQEECLEIVKAFVRIGTRMCARVSRS